MAPHLNTDGDQHTYINSGVIFVKRNTPIKDTVRKMIDRNISSILVEEDDGIICGIITERDIVRKFTLLDMNDKLVRTAGTLMTQPVMFVHPENLNEQIMKLHYEHRVRHFPVLGSDRPHRDDLLGIVSITDVARFHMNMAKMTGKSAATGAVSGSTVEQQSPKILIISNEPSERIRLQQTFNGLGFRTTSMEWTGAVLGVDGPDHTLLVDMDSFDDAQIKLLIGTVVHRPNRLLFVTGRSNLVPVFRKTLHRDHQDIALKPLDLSYLSWLLTVKWNSSSSKA